MLLNNEDTPLTVSARLILFLVTISLHLSLGCGNGGDESVHSSSNVPDTVFLDIRSTLGVSTGDSNFVFGEIAEIRETASGGIMVLDRARKQLLEYDLNGNFVQAISREGSGPGEFLSPVDFDIDISGNIYVLDIMRGMLMKFSGSGEFISAVQSYSGFPPLMFELSCDSSYIPLTVQEEVSETGELIIYSSISSVMFSDGESHEHWGLLSPVDLTAIEGLYYSSVLAVVYDVDSRGNVYYAPVCNDEYHLISDDHSGNIRFEVLNEVDQVSKTDTELYEEMEYVKCLAGWFGGGIDHEFDPPPFRSVISDIDLDSSDRVWIRNGQETLPVFDIYSDSGEHMLTVVILIPENCRHLMWEFEIGHSISAFPLNPDDYHRIYRFGEVDEII